MARKRCSGCKVEQEPVQFARNATKADGLATYCRRCNAAQRRAWKATHPQYKKAQYRKHKVLISARGKRRYATDAGYRAQIVRSLYPEVPSDWMPARIALFEARRIIRKHA